MQVRHLIENGHLVVQGVEMFCRATILTRIRATVANTWQKLQLLLEQQYISTTSTAEWQVFIKCLTCVTVRPGVASWTHANIAADAVKACATI